jgi:hypothetical protein
MATVGNGTVISAPSNTSSSTPVPSTPPASTPPTPAPTPSTPPPVVNGSALPVVNASSVPSGERAAAAQLPLKCHLITPSQILHDEAA